MILFGKTQKERDESIKSLKGKAKLIVTIFFITAFLPVILYLAFEFGLLGSKPKYNEPLEQSVALVTTGASTGTSFLVSETKLLTAKHVVNSLSTGDEVSLTFEKLDPPVTTQAKIIWVDGTNEPEPNYYLRDVAVLELIMPTDLPEDHPYLTIGSSEGVETRTEVILIGYPGGLMSITSGSISNDNLKGIALFQLDVESWPGNSGGPLILEETEEVIGMLVAGLTQEYQGINFASKIDNITELIEEAGIDLYE